MILGLHTIKTLLLLQPFSDVVTAFPFPALTSVFGRLDHTSSRG